MSDVGTACDMVATSTSMQSLLLSTHNVDEFLGALASLAAGIVDPPASVGITVRRNGQPFTVAASDQRALQADEAQYDAGRGPCVQTLVTGLVVEVMDQRSDDRWSEYAQRAAELGIRCSLSLPLIVDGAAVGALNLYGHERLDAFDGGRARAEVFAAQASTALAVMMRQAAHAAETQQLEQALTSRTVIDQALGVVMGQQRCTADEAFALLRMHSQNTNRKLRDVAAELIERQTGQPPSAPRGFQRTTAGARRPPDREE